MSRAPVLFAILLAACASAPRTDTAAPVAGTPAPALAGPALDGAALDLAALRGRVVLVDFWASWCEPCRRELPELEALHKQYNAAGLTVIGVNIDEERAVVDAFLRDQVPVSFPIVHDPKQALADRWAPPKMPTLYLVDRDGNIGRVFPGETPIATIKEEVARRLQ
jgi:cytochrome c biogenesis protein CcmG/thiol:disulfide interchange protein DsbE